VQSYGKLRAQALNDETLNSKLRLKFYLEIADYFVPKIKQ